MINSTLKKPTEWGILSAAGKVNVYFGSERIYLYMEVYFAVVDRHWTLIVVNLKTVRLLKKSLVELSKDH